MVNWLQLSATSGHGDTQITITASTNEELSHRLHTLTVSTSQKSVEVPVTQYGDANMYKYLTFEIVSAGSINWVSSNYYDIDDTSSYRRTIQYRVNGGDWQYWQAYCAGYSGNNVVNPSSIYVYPGDVVEFKGDNPFYGGGLGSRDSSTFNQSTAGFKVSGNIMSLIDSENFYYLTSLDYPYAFSGMFRRCSGLIDASELMLPALKVAEGAYGNMFTMCTAMTAGPALPATDVGPYAYQAMFANCRSLTTAPELPAMKIGESSYYGMFLGCYSLQTPPDLPAIELAPNCYQYMFSNCTSLTSGPDLPATRLSDYCYANMFSACTQLSSLKCMAYGSISYTCTSGWLDNANSNGTIYSYDGANIGRPVNWTKMYLDHPYLTFTMLTNGTVGWKAGSNGVAKTIEYSINNGGWQTIASTTAGATFSVNSGDVVRFRGDNTTYSDGLASSRFTSTARFEVSGSVMSLITASNYTDLTAFSDPYVFCGLFSGCTGLTDASKLMLPATGLTEGCYSAMFKNCTSLKRAPSIAVTPTYADYCFESMYEGCVNLVEATVTFGVNTVTTATYYAKKMFAGCTSLVEPPGGSVTTNATEPIYYQISEGCYEGIFSGCTSLLYAPRLRRAAVFENCYKSMFAGCTSLLVAPKLDVANLVEGCYQEMFKGCTSLEYLDCEAEDITATNCTTDWLTGANPNGTFVKNPNTLWSTGTSGIPSGWASKTPDTDPRSQYLTLNITQSGNIRWQTNGEGSSIYSCTLTYRINGGAWQDITSRSPFSGVNAFNVSVGDVVECYCNNMSMSGFYQSTAKFTVSGNIMSMSMNYSDDWNTRVTLGVDRAFYYLFLGCTGLTRADQLLLPALKLRYNTYYGLFEGCTGLTSTPVLQAKILGESCYLKMFAGCTSLTTAPALPVRKLASQCYVQMFSGCTSLSAAPALPATELANGCYIAMFEGCTSLTTTPTLPTATLVSNCYSNMFYGCTGLRTAGALNADKLTIMCYYQMFQGCTSLTTPPVISATKYDYASMRKMFKGCTSLTSMPTFNATEIPMEACREMFVDCTSLTSVTLPNTNNIKEQCYALMFTGCTGITSVELNAEKVPIRGYEEMFNGCTNLNYIKCIASDHGAYMTTSAWVADVAETGTFIKDRSTYWVYGIDGIPYGWNVKDYNPVDNGYLTFNIVSGGSINWMMTKNTAPACTIEYKVNNGAWTSVTSSTAGTSFNVSAGDVVRFRGTNSTLCSGTYGASPYFYSSCFSGSTASFNLTGNIMSLLYGDNYLGQAALVSAYTFAGLFAHTKVIDASQLELPATLLSNYCYYMMFYDCADLTKAPELPATVLTTHCYEYMYWNCPSLTIASAMYATTMDEYCCRGMYQGCSSLVTPPQLPALNLARECYQGMFMSCTAMTSMPALPATDLQRSCYDSMFYGCTSLTATKELPAQTIARSAYYRMFYNCTSLGYVKCLATYIGSSGTSDWLVNVAASGTFVKDPTMTWSSGSSGIPSGWSVQDNT